MAGKENKILRALTEDEKRKAFQEVYPCVWYGFKCPIRSKWKLSPENLSPWCTVCEQIGYLTEQKAKIKKSEKE